MCTCTDDVTNPFTRIGEERTQRASSANGEACEGKQEDRLCVCMFYPEREGECVCVCEREKEWVRVCVCV